ncbi:MAG: 12-oxophytodienoate reductase, partial [Sphingomonadales bacterium]
VEVHGAHGYLLDQFLWNGVNERNDEYGGDAVRRAQFAVDVIGAIRRSISSDFPLILRISQWKQQDYTARLAASPEELSAIFKPIADAGVDIFHCSQRRWWEPEFAGSDLNLAGWIKRLLNRPTITVGSVGLASEMSVTNLDETAVPEFDLAPLAARLRAGEFDLVAVGRALLADPQWVESVRTGDTSKIRRFDKSALDELH